MTATTMLLIMGLWTMTGALVALALGRAIACADAQRIRGRVATPATATATDASPVPAPRAQPAGEQLEVTFAVAGVADPRP